MSDRAPAVEVSDAMAMASSSATARFKEILQNLEAMSQAGRVEMLETILSAVVSEPPSIVAFVSAGGVDALQRLCTGSSASVKKQCCGILAVCCTRPGVAEDIGRCGFAEIARELLTSSEVTDQLLATRLLIGLAQAAGNLNALRAIGVVKFLAQTWLQVPGEVVLEYARLAFRLCAYDCFLREICDHGLVPVAYKRLAQEENIKSGNELVVGVFVEVRGLQSRADLNGRHGQITQHDSSTGRFEVLLVSPPEERIRCKPMNLVRSSSCTRAPVEAAGRSLEDAEKNQLLEVCSAIRICAWHWRGDSALPGLTELRVWITWSSAVDAVKVEAHAAMAMSSGQTPALLTIVEALDEYAPLLLWSTSLVGKGALQDQLVSLQEAGLAFAKQLEDPLLTREVVDTLVDFLLEDLTTRSGYFSRALLALKQRRVRADAAGVAVDFSDVIALCDLFRQHMDGTTATIRGRLPLEGSPEASYTLACELLIDLFLAVFGEHVQCMSVEKPSVLDNCR